MCGAASTVQPFSSGLLAWLPGVFCQSSNRYFCLLPVLTVRHFNSTSMRYCKFISPAMTPWYHIRCEGWPVWTTVVLTALASLETQTHIPHYGKPYSRRRKNWDLLKNSPKKNGWFFFPDFFYMHCPCPFLQVDSVSPCLDGVLPSKSAF